MTSVVYAVSFLALASLAGLGAAGGAHWLLRLPLIACTPVLAIAVWWQLSQRDGLPISARPADGSTFVAGVVQAPTPGSGGAIYLWTRPPGSDTPRSYRLPYSPQLEQQVAQAARAAKKGAPVGLRVRRRRGQARGDSGQLGRQVSALSFYRLRAPRQPVKQGPP
jgi:hypothetical protein